MGYYSIIKAIDDFISTDGIVNTVTNGDIFSIDLKKRTIFPLAHITVNTATIEQASVTMNVSVLFMDSVGTSKKSKTSDIDSNDREIDVLNTQLELAKRLIASLYRGDLNIEGYELTSGATCEPFIERFENNLAGWAVTFDAVEKNDMTIC